MEKLGSGLKKVLLAGIGAVAVTGEKSKELLDEMVKKGELTVEQGKALNEELKHNIKSTVQYQRYPPTAISEAKIINLSENQAPDALLNKRSAHGLRKASPDGTPGQGSSCSPGRSL